MKMNVQEIGLEGIGSEEGASLEGGIITLVDDLGWVDVKRN